MANYTDISYGPHPQNIFDLWLADSPEPCPLVVFIHGGGFVGGSKDGIAPETVETYLKNGISVASVEYRFIEHAPLPAAHHDSRYALQFIRSKADEWNIDRSRIAGYGGSAGAQICMYLGFHADMAQPDADDPIERESTRLQYVGTRGGQTTMDPALWVDWIPGYWEHRNRPEMFGMSPGPEFDRCVAEYSAMNMPAPDMPPIFTSYTMAPDDPIPEEEGMARNWKVHHVIFGIKLKEKMDAMGLESHLAYPGQEELPFDSIESFFLAKLEREKRDE